MLKKVKKAKKAEATVAEKPVKTVTAELVETPVTTSNVGKLDCKRALAQAREIFKDVEKNLVTWAAVLYEIRDKEYYKDLHYSTYKDYVEGEFKVSIRTAQNKVETYKVLCLENGVEPEVLEKVGHRKGLLLKQGIEKGLIDSENLPSRIETALNSTDVELKSVINGAKKTRAAEEDGEGENNPKSLNGDTGKQSAWDFSTRISGADAIEIVQQAKEKMDIAEGKEVSQAVFLERLAMEYLASSIHKSKRPIEYYCRLLKESYPDHHIIAVAAKYAEKFTELSKQLLKAPAKEPRATVALKSEDAPPPKKKLKKKVKRPTESAV